MYVRATPPKGQNTEKTSLAGASLGGFAFFLYLMMIVFTLLSVASRFSAIGVVRPTVLFLACISTLLLLGGAKSRVVDQSTISRWLIILIAYIFISLPFVEWPGSVLRFGLENFAKAVVFFFFTVQLINTVNRLKWFLFVLCACQTIRVLEPLYLHLTEGYWGSRAHMGGDMWLDRLAGGPADFINPNGLAFVIVTTLPILHHTLGKSTKSLFKLIYMALAGMFLHALVLTGSRSGVICLCAAVGVIIWRSKYRTLMFGVAVAVGMLLFAGMTADQKDRYLSIAGGGSQNIETRDGRLKGLLRDFSVGLTSPIVGHGLGTSGEANYNVARVSQVSHNLVNEVFIELGAVGLAIFIAFLLSVMRNVIVALTAAREASERLPATNLTNVDSFIYRCSEATFVLSITCVVFSMASYGLSLFTWYLIAGLSVVVRNVRDERLTT